jgi:hypothetical protein
LIVSENSGVKIIFERKSQELTGGYRKRMMKSFIIYSLHQILLESSNDGGWNGWGMGNMRNAYTTFR